MLHDITYVMTSHDVTNEMTSHDVTNVMTSHDGKYYCNDVMSFQMTSHLVAMV